MRTRTRGVVVGLAMALLGLGATPAPAHHEPSALQSNSVCGIPTDYVQRCGALDVADDVEVDVSEGTDQVRFFACPTAGYGPQCIARGPWQPGNAVRYPAEDAGRWAVVLARGTSQPGGVHDVASDARPLARGPVIDEDASYEVLGTLPDGTVRPGMTIDVRLAPGVPDPPVTGDPAPDVARNWLQDTHTDAAPFGLWLPSRSGYDGPLVVPEVDRLHFEVLASNPAGRDYLHQEVLVRRPPRFVGRPLPPLTEEARIGATVGSAQHPAVDRRNVAGWPLPEESWQWRRCTVEGCVDILGATARLHGVGPSDGGSWLERLRIARNAEGRAEELDLRTGLVAPKPQTCTEATATPVLPRLTPSAIRALRAAVDRRGTRPLGGVARRAGVRLVAGLGDVAGSRPAVVRSLSTRSRTVVARGTRVTTSRVCAGPVAIYDHVAITVLPRRGRAVRVSCVVPRTATAPGRPCAPGVLQQVRRIRGR